GRPDSCARRFATPESLAAPDGGRPWAVTHRIPTREAVQLANQDSPPRRAWPRRRGSTARLRRPRRGPPLLAGSKPVERARWSAPNRSLVRALRDGRSELVSHISDLRRRSSATTA